MALIWEFRSFQTRLELSSAKCRQFCLGPSQCVNRIANWIDTISTPKPSTKWAPLLTVTRSYTILIDMFNILMPRQMTAGLILGLRPANERRRYFVTTSLTGWAQALNQPCDHHFQDEISKYIFLNEN